MASRTLTKEWIVMTISILMLWNVKIAWRKRLALMGIFTLTLIVIIFSNVRVSVVTTAKSQADITWLFMWCRIKMAAGQLVHSASQEHERSDADNDRRNA